jgi:hypothetical protein
LTQQFRDALDRFKQQLGVPVPLPLELDDAPFRPLVSQQRRFLEVVSQFEEVRNIVNRTEWAAEPEKLRQRLRETADASPLVRGTRFREEFPARWAAMEQLTNEQIRERIGRLRDERRVLLNQRTDLQVTGEKAPPDLAARLAAIERDLELLGFAQSLRNFEAKPWERPGADPARLAAARASAFRDAASDFAVLLGEARNERQTAGRNYPRPGWAGWTSSPMISTPPLLPPASRPWPTDWT